MATENRRLMTLSDQLAVPDSSDLRDLLRTHNSSRRRRRRRSGGGALTLASTIAADKTNIPSSSSARTLLDALREDVDGDEPISEVRSLRPRRGGATRTASVEAPVRLSLMALLEEEEVVGQSWRCCVCMMRQKGAAFIPCGHTFCRRCSWEVWVRRWSCPLCNAAVDNILNIY